MATALPQDLQLHSLMQPVTRILYARHKKPFVWRKDRRASYMRQLSFYDTGGNTAMSRQRDELNALIRPQRWRLLCDYARSNSVLHVNRDLLMPRFDTFVLTSHTCNCAARHARAFVFDVQRSICSADSPLVGASGVAVTP